MFLADNEHSDTFYRSFAHCRADDVHRLQQSLNLLVFATELAFLACWKQN